MDRSLQNVLQPKIVFDDRLKTTPRGMPAFIALEPQRLGWDNEGRPFCAVP